MKYSLKQSDIFEGWLKKLSKKKKDEKRKILLAVAKMKHGNFADSTPVGDGISELRLHFGAGYRVYYKITGNTVVILLNGGTKGSQQNDIKTAKAVAEEY